MIRRVVFYSGRVHGVGFRFYTANHAKRFAVAGYVQNLDDGRVRLDVQGERRDVAGLIGAVGQTLAHYITRTDGFDAPPDEALGTPGQDGAFVIRRYAWIRQYDVTCCPSAASRLDFFV